MAIEDPHLRSKVLEVVESTQVSVLKELWQVERDAWEMKIHIYQERFAMLRIRNTVPDRLVGVEGSIQRRIERRFREIVLDNAEKGIISGVFADLLPPPPPPPPAPVTPVLPHKEGVWKMNLTPDLSASPASYNIRSADPNLLQPEQISPTSRRFDHVCPFYSQANVLFRPILCPVPFQFSSPPSSPLPLIRDLQHSLCHPSPRT